MKANEATKEKVFKKKKWYSMDEWIQGREALPAQPIPKLQMNVWKYIDKESRTFEQIFLSQTKDLEASCLTPAQIAKISDDSPTWFLDNETTNMAMFLFKKGDECFVAVVKSKNMILKIMEWSLSDTLLYMNEIKYKVVVII